MSTEFLDNTHTRVWIVDDFISSTYCGRTAVARILFKKSKAMILLQERLTTDPYKNSEFLQFFSNHADIFITHVEVGRPDCFANNEILLRLRKCFLERSWINKLTILEQENSSPVDLFFQVEAMNYAWMK